MGNCQAVDNATMVIQYPTGRVEKHYSPVLASAIMKMNPGHCVALLLTTTTTAAAAAAVAAAPSFSSIPDKSSSNNLVSATPLRITRIKLLRPTDTLSLGHVYRLITTQEVMKGLCARKYAKLKKRHSDSNQFHPKSGLDFQQASRSSQIDKSNQVTKHQLGVSIAATEGAAGNAVASRSKAWQPSLNSISETGS